MLKQRLILTVAIVFSFLLPEEAAAGGIGTQHPTVLTVPAVLHRCQQWAIYSATHPAAPLPKPSNVTVRGFFVEHISTEEAGRRGGLYGARVPNDLFINPNDNHPFVYIGLGGTPAGRSLPSGRWVIVHAKLSLEQCSIYDVSNWQIAHGS